jgi:hypothetical protein
VLQPSQHSSMCNPQNSVLCHLSHGIMGHGNVLWSPACCHEQNAEMLSPFPVQSIIHSIPKEYIYNKHLEFLFTYDFRQHEKNLEMTLQ